MYLKFEQVILVSDQSKVRSSDPVVYVRELRGERVLALDGSKQYGHIYYDASDNPCVVPDSTANWEEDRMLAKDWR